jgi:hypothetical protein
MPKDLGNTQSMKAVQRTVSRGMVFHTEFSSGEPAMIEASERLAF